MEKTGLLVNPTHLSAVGYLMKLVPFFLVARCDRKIQGLNESRPVDKLSLLISCSLMPDKTNYTQAKIVNSKWKFCQVTNHYNVHISTFLD